MANYSWPVSASTVNSGPVQFVRDGVDTQVRSDSVTPANSRPLPVRQFNSTGAPVDGATEQTALQIETAVESIDLKTPALGQALMAASSPVVISSDQSPVSVSGPLTDTELRATPVPVSGPLTDTELRATPVAVSGPLTDTELRATPVPVSGPLTDAELRASAVPVAPNISRGAGAVDADTTRVTVSSDGPLMTSIGAPADAAATTDTGTFSIIAFIKRGLQNWTTLLARVPVLGQATMANSIPVVISSDQSGVPVSQAAATNGTMVNTTVGTTAASQSPPANAIGFTLQANDANDGNLRFAIGATATASVGSQLQPGRSSGYLPVNAAISIVSESGTQGYQLQWIRSV